MTVRAAAAITLPSVLLVLMWTPSALGDAPCSKCSGAEMFDPVACPAGTDLISVGQVTIGIDLSFDCVSESDLTLSGDFTIQRQAASGGVIDLAIEKMVLTDASGLTLVAGEGYHEGPHPVAASTGTAVDNGDGTAVVTLNVYFEAKLPDFDPPRYGYNGPSEPLVMTGTISCIPPLASLTAPEGVCIFLYDSPTPGLRAIEYAKATSTGGAGGGGRQEMPPEHEFICGNGMWEPEAGEPECDPGCPEEGNPPDDAACPGQCQEDCTCRRPDIPTVSEWGLIGLGLLFLVIGTVVFSRRRIHRSLSTE